jgi:twitching motility protein PilT
MSQAPRSALITVKLIEYVHAAQEAKASDILLSAGAPPAFRVNGSIVRAEAAELTGSQINELLGEVLTNKQLDAFGRGNEMDFAITFAGQRMRGAAYLSDGHPALTLRLLPTKIPAAEELGLPQVLFDMIQHAHGLLLCSGAAGQGKSTTLACLIDYLNRHEQLHIVTVEDPIEYVHHSQRSIVDQREVGTDTESFGVALRHVLRQTPDVILIGEMRDRETFEAALTIAETGHLVLSTMHASDTPHAIDRIVSSFPLSDREFVRSQLAMVMLAIVNQKLLPDLHNSRSLACEVLVNSPAVANMIRDGRIEQLYSALDTDRARGSIGINQSLIDLVNGGRVHKAVARRHVNLKGSNSDKLVE